MAGSGSGVRKLVLLAGPAALLASTVVPAGALGGQGLRVAGLGVWMALWWLTAVVPLPVTALLPIIVIPLIGAGSIAQATASYANPVIFLFMGGFFIAATLERWDLHKAFAVATLRIVGDSARLVILAFMGIAAFASMWITNTATAVMLLPIAVAVANRSSAESTGFATALMLGVAYGASIGGIATLIGTPPNAILAATAPELVGREIGFGSWIGFGLAVSIPMLLMAWLVLTTLFGVKGRVDVAGSVADFGSSAGPGGGTRFVVAVFAGTALAWVFRAPKEIGGIRVPGLADLLPGVSDAGIAIAASVLLLVVPLRNGRFRTALDWETARGIQWGVLILFGGGLALAGAFERSGLTTWIGGLISALHGVPLPVIILVCTGTFVILTELTSNTATAALGMPVVAGAAEGLGVPALPLMIAAALGASMAFMLPVATPPNAIVYSSGMVTNRDMARAGVVLNAIAIAVITIAVSVAGIWR